MQPVSVTLLAALLPTLLIILALSCLSIYLFAELREARSKPFNVQPPSTAEPPSTSKQESKPSEHVILRMPIVEPRYFVGERITSLFSPDGKPDMKQDLIFLSCHSWANRHLVGFELGFESKDDMYCEAEVGDHLAALGYTGMSAASFLRLLRNRPTRRLIGTHLLMDSLLRWTSLEGDPRDSLLPLTAQQHVDLRAYFHALEGVKFSPDVATELAKLPFTLARAENVPRANHIRFTEIFSNLFRRIGSGLLWSQFREGTFHLHPKNMELDDFVFGRFRLLANFQKYGLTWPESTEARFYVRPEVWTYMGKDGKFLEEKRILLPSECVTVDEDGVATVMRGEKVFQVVDDS